MSLPKPDIHVRLCEEAHAKLRAIAFAEGGEDYPVASMAARLLEEAILGRAHTLKVAAGRLREAGFIGSGRE